jgi:hypothetical protein
MTLSFAPEAIETWPLERLLPNPNVLTALVEVARDTPDEPQVTVFDEPQIK